MYNESDLKEVDNAYKKRCLLVWIPFFVLLAIVIGSYIVLHNARNDNGWIVTGLLTVLSGGFLIFFMSVYVYPVKAYRTHVQLMLTGRKRETIGLLTEIDDQPKNRDGIDCISMVINTGDKNDPEDERLFYFDTQKGKPSMPVGTRVKVLSNDRMIASISEVE